MIDTNADANKAIEAPSETVAADKKPAREQSSIGFPYTDLDDAIGVAAALLGCGGVPCDPDQLAGAMKQTPSSGSFRMKIATARMFGLIETIQGKYNLTELGFAITDPTRQKAARADAFLNVPLYRKVYDTFRNQQLPPRPIALERTFVGFGVAQKQADRARTAFDRSAQQAGYFESGGRDRLIRPPAASVGNGNGAPNADPVAAPEAFGIQQNPAAGGGGGSSPGGNGADLAHLDSLLIELLKKIPAASNEGWPGKQRLRWFKTFAMNVSQIYDDDASPVDLKIEIETGDKN